jgi:flavodoxin
MKDILILYYSKNDSTKRMARAISRGIESVADTTAVIRTGQIQNIMQKVMTY